MEKKLLIPALALSFLSFTAFAAGTSSDSTADVNKLTMPSFEEMDTNHDGMMSKSEFDAGMASMHTSRGISSDSSADAAKVTGNAPADSMSHDSMAK